MQKVEKRFLAAIMFTDIESFSKMSNLDQENALEMAQVHRDVIQHSVYGYNGECVNFYGDGSLSIFRSANKAALCAIEIQRKFQKETKIPVRVGLHLGEVIQDDNSVYSDSVNIASRIQALAPIGGILISESIKNAIGASKEFNFTKLGVEKLKNIPTPVALYSIQAAGLSIADKASIHSKAVALHPPKPYNPFRISFFSVLFLLIILLAVLKINGKRIDHIPPELFNARLAVMPFKNKSGSDQDSILSQVAAKEVFDMLRNIEGTRLVSYDDWRSYKPLNQASVFQNSNVPRATEAVNLLQGEYQITGDSITFSAHLRNVETPEYAIEDYIHIFKEEKSHKEKPMVALLKLVSNIKGYWKGSQQNLLVSTNYEAFKPYFKAIELWPGSDSLTFSLILEYLNESIALDSTFLDAYMMKLDFFYNTYEDDAFKDWHQTIVQKFPDDQLDSHQKNMMDYNRADVVGNNVAAFHYFKKEYERDPKELFTNINMAVLSMEYVNDAHYTLEVLSQIEVPEEVYISCNYCNRRLILGIRAALDLQMYKHALNLVAQFPEKASNMLIDERTNELANYLTARTYIAIGDSIKLFNFLRTSKILLEEEQLVALYFYAAKDAAILGHLDLSQRLARDAIPLVQNPFFTKRLYYLLGDYTSAYDLANTSYEKSNSISAGIQMAYYSALTGKEEKARQFLLKIEADNDLGNPYYLSYVYVALGDYDTALDYLEQSVRAGEIFSSELFHWDIHLKPLFDNPRFDRIIHPLSH